MLGHCLNKNRSYLFTWPENNLDNEQQHCFESLIKKRLTDYPVAYLVGTKAFWTLDLIVTPDVLIPRPETELLVEIALKKIADIKSPKILELGTGSGAIALALATERHDATILACDYSVKALEIAKLNTRKNKITNISFVESDWYTNISDRDYDLIVSNPPYIAKNDPHLLQTIRHEPQQALVADNLGLEDLESLVKKSKKHLKKGGWLLLEHGYNQSQRLLDFFIKYELKSGQTYSDLNNVPRISIAQY